MGGRDGVQLVEGLGHADVESLFAPVAAGQDELHAQSRFAGARPAFDEVEAAEDEAAAEDVVQSRQPGRGPVASVQSSHSLWSGRGCSKDDTKPARSACPLLSYQDNSQPQGFVHRQAARIKSCSGEGRKYPPDIARAGER